MRRAVAQRCDIPREQALEIWQRSGRPAIPLRQGETCFDLEKFLSHSNIRDSDIEAIKTWVQETIRRKEAEVPNEKGHCKHGEFILMEGCPQCIAERRTGQIGLEPAPELIGAQLAEEAGIVEAEDGDESYSAPYNTSYHAPYRLQDGTIVPGVTTVLNILDKPGLPHWAWDLGTQGLDYREVRDAAGRVGTLAHHLIACHLKSVTSVSGGYPPDEVEKAEKCLAKYLAWEKQNTTHPVMVETPLVSEEFKYGGTPDLLAEIDGEFVLIDFKTGGGIYNSYFYQVAAYRKLLEEQGWPVARAWILRISPDDSEYEVAMLLDLDRDWQIFQHCLAIYRLQSEVTHAKT